MSNDVQTKQHQQPDILRSRYMKILTLIVILLVVLPSLVQPAKYCSARKNRFYKDGKCRRCPQCVNLEGPGFGRNVSEQIQLQHGRYGDLECYPCMKCPRGYFNDGSYRECAPCRVDCKNLNRTIDIPCNSKSDSVCGKCLDKHYCPEDDRHFPCVPLPSPALGSQEVTTEQATTERRFERITTTERSKIQQTFEEKPTGGQAKTLALQQNNEYEENDELLGTLPLIVVVVLAVIGAIIYVVVKECLPEFERKRLCRCSKHEAAAMSSTATMVKGSQYNSAPGKENSIAFLSGSDDLQVDGGSDENVTSKTPLMQQPCRAEIPVIVTVDQIIPMTKPSYSTEAKLGVNEEENGREPGPKVGDTQAVSFHDVHDTLEKSYDEEDELQSTPKRAQTVMSGENTEEMRATAESEDHEVAAKAEPHNDESRSFSDLIPDGIQTQLGQNKDEDQPNADSKVQKEKVSRYGLLTERQVRFIATHMETDGSELFAELKLPDCELNPIKIEYFHKNLTPKELIYRALMRWREIEAKNATFEYGVLAVSVDLFYSTSDIKTESNQYIGFTKDFEKILPTFVDNNHLQVYRKLSKFNM